MSESIFIGKWINEHAFYSHNTKMKKFYLHNNSINIMTMINTNKSTILSSHNNNITAALLNYISNNYKMLIFMPQTPARTTKELVSLFDNSSNVNKFIEELKPINYGLRTMPKFNTESNFNLGSVLNNNSYTSPLFQKSANYSNLIKNHPIIENIQMIINSNISNDEIGTTIISHCLAAGVDSCSTGSSQLCINKPFLYIILSKENVISNIGCFMG